METLKWLGDLLAMIVAGSPLILVIMAIVEFIKRLGMQGKWLLITSMITGVVVGTGYQLSVVFPVTFADYFKLVISGLTWGLAASGVFEAIKSATTKSITKSCLIK
jgi:hypothetical protein